MREEVLLGALLRRLGLTRQYVADRVGVSVQTVHNWSHRHPIPLPQLEPLAELLREHGSDEQDLLGFLTHELERHGLDSNLIGLLQSPPLHHQAHDPSADPIVIVGQRLSAATIMTLIATTCRLILERVGYRCVVFNSNDFPMGGWEAVELAVRVQARAVMFFVPATSQADLGEMATTLGRSGISVLFAQCWRDPSRLPRRTAGFRLDSTAIARIATDTLKRHGHDSIGVLFMGTEGALARTFMHQAASIGLSLAAVARSQDGIIPAAELERLITNQHAAVFVASPGGLPILADALNSAGRAWPRDISILGVGAEGHTLQAGSKPFSIINVPTTAIAEQAVSLLLELIETQHDSARSPFIIYGEETFHLLHEQDGSLQLAPTATTR